MNFTKRDNEALEILKAGGYFRHALETDQFTHREQFQTRLRNARGQVMKGFGFAAKNKFISAGLLMSKPCGITSTWATEHQLSYSVKFALVLAGEF